MIFTQDGPMDAGQWIENTGEPRARKRASAVRRRAGGKGLCKQYLACCLSYFLLGFSGPKEEAEEIKQQLEVFLREELKLELSQAKTLITHAKSEAARFLGYEISITQDDTKQTMRTTPSGKEAKARCVNGRVVLRVPQKKLEGMCEAYKDGETIRHRMELINESDYTIMMAYQLKYRGIVNYYQLALNVHSLNHLKWVMETSLTKTLAHKHKMSVSQVYRKYRTTLQADGKTYRGLRVVVPRERKKPLVAQWGGIPLKRNMDAIIEDQMPHLWPGRSELEKRLLAEVCELCGRTDQIEVHVRRFGGRDRAHQMV